MQRQVCARTVAVCGAVVVLAAAGVARAETPDLIEVGTDRVRRWDIDSPGVQYDRLVGSNLFGDMTRLADGRIVAYRTTYGGHIPALYEINPETGAVAVLVESAAGAGEVVALTTMPDGNLLGRDNTLGFVRIDPATLAWSRVPLVGPYPTDSMFSGGMATSPGGQIYAWCSGFGGPGTGVYSKLFRIDPVAGTATAIGGYENLSVSVAMEAMAFTPDGRLFGFTEINGRAPLQANSVYELNLQTGLPTFVAQRSELADARGAVFLPDPAAAPAALLLGVGALARRRRRAPIGRWGSARVEPLAQFTPRHEGHALDTTAAPIGGTILE